MTPAQWSEHRWGEVRAQLDSIGMIALEQAIANGTPRELAGARIAEFNDMVLERLKEELG